MRTYVLNFVFAPFHIADRDHVFFDYTLASMNRFAGPPTRSDVIGPRSTLSRKRIDAHGNRRSWNRSSRGRPPGPSSAH